ncbi:unnamed protein product [Prorocentrum cordatum]|uniref:DNA (cytosine-5-)-methyltransferase n=1 Tax=Prorocentrum cordatum TaxID=2364126 RepID=A0ABN9PWF7_9DINO|nr:unnamed protein product [Polarella glacialis]
MDSRPSDFCSWAPRAARAVTSGAALSPSLLPAAIATAMSGNGPPLVPPRKRLRGKGPADPLTSFAVISGGLDIDTEAPLEPNAVDVEDLLDMLPDEGEHGDMALALRSGDSAGGGPGQDPHMETWWVERALKSFDADQIRRLFSRGVLTYGSDATGANAPFEALRCIRKAMQTREADASFGVHHEFASEDPSKKGDSKRAFILANGPEPDVLFADMCARGATGVTIDGGRFSSKSVNIYVAGFECHDLCALNRHAKPLDIEDADAGSSSQTLKASFEYIERRAPSVVILENLNRKNTVKVILQYFADNFPHYEIDAFALDNLQFGLPSSRERLYVVAVNLEKVTLFKKILDWEGDLNNMVAELTHDRFGVETFFFEDDHPEVQRLFEHLVCVSEGRHFKKASKDTEWAIEHDEVRRTLRSVHLLDVPDDTAAWYRSTGDDAWFNLLQVRQQDMLSLHAWVAKEVLNIDISSVLFIWDLTVSMAYPQDKDLSKAGRMPCVLRHHDYWLSTKRRLVCGAELLSLQGFAHNVCLGGLTNAELSDLAGNTMGVPVVGSLLACLLANAKFEQPLERKVAEHNRGKDPDRGAIKINFPDPVVACSQPPQPVNSLSAGASVVASSSVDSPQQSFHALPNAFKHLRKPAPKGAAKAKAIAK